MDAIAPHFDPAKAPLPAALKEELVSRKLHLSPCRLLATYIISTLMTGTGRSTIEDSRDCVEETIQLARILASRGPLTHEKGSISLETGLGQKISELFSSPVFREVPAISA